MSTILKSDKREFQEDPNKIDNFRLFPNLSRKKNGIIPQNLHFDSRLLNPGQFSAPYHFHRNAEELFMVVSGSMTLRTPNGLDIVPILIQEHLSDMMYVNILIPVRYY